MTDRPSQPEPEQTGRPHGPAGPDPLCAEQDPGELELPASMTAALKARYGAPVEVPAYVDAVVLTEWAEHLSKGGARGGGGVFSGWSRRKAWAFAGMAAAVAGMVWIGTSTLRRPSGGDSRMLAQGAIVGGAVAEELHERAPLADASGGARMKSMSSGGGAEAKSSALEVPAMTAAQAVDADHNGKVNVLDVLRVAKTVQAVQLARRAESTLSPEAAKKMAFFVESLDVTWDLTGDGVVDQKDVDAMASRVVKVGG